MSLVAFLRGVNVGGHRTFRPSVVTHSLRAYDVINVGAAGTFVVRKRCDRSKFRAALLKKLPFEADLALCDGDRLLRFVAEHPFGREPPPPGVTRFVSVLLKPGTLQARIPFKLPPEGEWLVNVLGASDRFVFGVYRRQMKTIRYLGQMDELLRSPTTTRNWNTILAIARILQPGDECHKAVRLRPVSRWGPKRPRTHDRSRPQGGDGDRASRRVTARDPGGTSAGAGSQRCEVARRKARGVAPCGRG